MPLTEALVNIHFPANPDLLRKAQYRLKFESFYVQLNILVCKRPSAEISRLYF